MKTLAKLMQEADAVVPRMTVDNAIAVHSDGGALFVDVRDSSDIQKTGTIAGALRIPRGMIEFFADPNSPHHNAAFQFDAAIHIVCGLGGQAALAGKSLKDMGFTNVTNVGGIETWRDANGPMEDG